MRDPEAKRITENVANSYRHWAEETALQEEERPVAEGDMLVDRQEQIVVELERGDDNKATAIAIAVLSTMRGCLVLAREHVGRLKRP